MLNFAFCLPVFFNAICPVVFWLAYKKMARVDAKSVVTCVTHDQPLRNGTLVKLVGNSMCADGFAAHLHSSVPADKFIPSPKPAAIRFANLLKEFLLKRLESLKINVAVAGVWLIVFGRLIHITGVFEFSRFPVLHTSANGAFIFTDRRGAVNCV